MEKLAKGEQIERVCFRKTDAAGELADKLNAIAEKLNLLKK